MLVPGHSAADNSVTSLKCFPCPKSVCTYTYSWEEVSLLFASDAARLVRAATLMGGNGLVQQSCITADSVHKISANTLGMSTP